MMKKLSTLAAAMLFALAVIPATAQEPSQTPEPATEHEETNPKSNGTIEIIALYVPDFIAFRPAVGTEFKKFEVALTEGMKSFKPFKTTAIGITINGDFGKSNYESIHTDQTEIRAMFNISENFFKADRIEFVIDGKKMAYDLAADAWAAE